MFPSSEPLKSTIAFKDIGKSSSEQILTGYEELDSGYVELDSIIGSGGSGFASPQLVAIGGRPCMGKTVFALSVAMHVCRSRPVAYFSPVVCKERVHQMSNCRIVGQMFERFSSVIERTATLDQSLECQEEECFLIDDAPCLTPSIVAEKVRAMEALAPISFVVIDNLQSMSSDNHCSSRAQELVEITQDLALLARELDLTILIVTDISPELENRSDKRPLVKDFTCAGRIELVADKIISLYRDVVYSPHTAARNDIEIDVHKNRQGCVGAL